MIKNLDTTKGKVQNNQFILVISGRAPSLICSISLLAIKWLTSYEAVTLPEVWLRPTWPFLEDVNNRIDNFVLGEVLMGACCIRLSHVSTYTWTLF